MAHFLDFPSNMTEDEFNKELQHRLMELGNIVGNLEGDMRITEQVIKDLEIQEKALSIILGKVDSARMSLNSVTHAPVYQIVNMKEDVKVLKEAYDNVRISVARLSDDAIDELEYVRDDMLDVANKLNDLTYEGYLNS